MRPTVSLHLLKASPEAGELPPPAAFARTLAEAGAARGEVTLVLTGAGQVRELNRRFRGEDRDTDVLAFDYGGGAAGGEALPKPAGGRTGGSGTTLWGDVYVSADAAIAQARELGIPAGEEIVRLFLHGCLHLLGHRDDEPQARARMEATQEALLTALLRRAQRARASR